MLCDICGAFTHLQIKCPYNPNNCVFVTENTDYGVEPMEDFQTAEIDGQECQEDTYYGAEGDHEQSYAEDIAKAMGSTKDQQRFYSVLETLTVMEVWKTDYQPVRKHTLRDKVGMMVLDTGCLKTVAGQVWFDAFVDSLDPEMRKMISAQESANVFKFGGGER